LARGEESPRLDLVTALPPSVWPDHFMPWLPLSEVAGLRSVCQAMKALVREWPVRMADDLSGGSVIKSAEKVEAALTCFPAMESLPMWFNEPLAPAEELRMVELLRGHGGTLKCVGSWYAEGSTERLLASAVRAGALPHLTQLDSFLYEPIHREILSGCLLPLLEEVEVMVQIDDGEQVAALGHLRRLKHLRSLKLDCPTVAQQAALPFPPFIPPSLKSLDLLIPSVHLLESLLRQLSSLLSAGGARLEAVKIDREEDPFAEWDTALARVLHTCRFSLKTLELRDKMQRLNVAYVPQLLPGLTSCCATLEVLDCPWPLFSALRTATCPTFPRLTTLNLEGTHEAVDLTSPVWDIMADGRLPALASLKVRFFQGVAWGQGEGGGDGNDRLSRAFEAVAGTLRRLSLRVGRGDEAETVLVGVPAGAATHLGLAIGKLRRLRYLNLELLRDGLEYRDLARGIAASGGCPELFELRIDFIEGHFGEFLDKPCLVVPSLRNLKIFTHSAEDEALLLCCGLVHMGYRHRLHLALSGPGDDNEDLPPSVLACIRAILRGAGLNAHVW
jgi:hypothetical protein